MIRTFGIAATLTAGLIGAAQAQTVLDVVAWKGNEAEPAGLPGLIEKFEAAHPDIEVELTYVARKDVDKVIPPRLQGGNPPDVTMVDSALVDLWGGAGFLTDLGTDSPWYDRMVPAVREVIFRIHLEKRGQASERFDLPTLSAHSDGFTGAEIEQAVVAGLYSAGAATRLDRSNLALDLEKLGFRPDELDAFRNLVAKPNGIILVTGPTGSGKTTTLYSVLMEANSVDVKIITTEDPVEYDLEGVIQVQVQEEIGLTFADCLRSILRQDPDKILVGEVRDLETAQIAVESSLTGHIVYSTLHTNDAPSSVTRILDLGLEPFLIAATLEGVIAQRLARRICLNCKTPYDPTEQELYELELTATETQGREFYFGKGCKSCNGTGYKGRVALFEMMIVNDRLRDLIMNSASTAELRSAAREDGMRTLRDSGLLHIYDGISTIEEVVRETISTV